MVVDWGSVWSSLNLWRFVRPVWDTNWSIAHAILPTADRLLHFGCDVDTRCHCGQIESLFHLFTQCTVTKRLVVWYQSLVFRSVLLLPHPSPSQLLVGYSSAVRIPAAFPCLLGIIHHRVWVARNGWRFDQTPVVFSSVLSGVKSSFRFLLGIQQRHCSGGFRGVQAGHWYVRSRLS